MLVGFDEPKPKLGGVVLSALLDVVDVDAPDPKKPAPDEVPLPNGFEEGAVLLVLVPKRLNALLAGPVVGKAETAGAVEVGAVSADGEGFGGTKGASGSEEDFGADEGKLADGGGNPAKDAGGAGILNAGGCALSGGLENENEED